MCEWFPFFISSVCYIFLSLPVLCFLLCSAAPYIINSVHFLRLSILLSVKPLKTVWMACFPLSSLSTKFSLIFSFFALKFLLLSLHLVSLSCSRGWTSSVQGHLYPISLQSSLSYSPCDLYEATSSLNTLSYLLLPASKSLQEVSVIWHLIWVLTNLLCWTVEEALS